jgi:predicted phage replisome organizer
MFDDEKIKLIEGLPEADAILVIWVKLLCLTGKLNAGGYIFLTERLPYTDEMLSTLFNRPLNVIRLALTTFEHFGMIEIRQQGIYLVNWQKYQNTDKLEQIKEQNRLRKQAERQRKILPVNPSHSMSHDSHSMSRDGHVTVARCHALDIDIDIDIDKDKDMIKSEVSLPDKINDFVVNKPNISHSAHSTSVSSLSLIEDQFNEFWKVYPSKIGKKAAFLSWKKIKPEADLFLKIISAVEKQKTSDSWQRGYIPHPSKWLNEARWEDEIKVGEPYGETGECFVPSKGFRST